MVPYEECSLGFVLLSSNPCSTSCMMPMNVDTGLQLMAEVSLDDIASAALHNLNWRWRAASCCIGRGDFFCTGCHVSSR